MKCLFRPFEGNLNYGIILCVFIIQSNILCLRVKLIIL